MALERGGGPRRPHPFARNADNRCVPARDQPFARRRCRGEIKLEVIRMRRFISPVRDLTAGLLRSESELIDPSTRIYLRDVHDHVLRIIESIETHRDILSSLLEIYLSSISSRLNEVMKVLTVFSSIFIPLTFITGIYGMNFEWMPELKWHWAYPAVWLVFITTSCTLFLYFKRRGWT